MSSWPLPLEKVPHFIPITICIAAVLTVVRCIAILLASAAWCCGQTYLSRRLASFGTCMSCDMCGMQAEFCGTRVGVTVFGWFECDFNFELLAVGLSSCIETTKRKKVNCNSRDSFQGRTVSLTYSSYP